MGPIQGDTRSLDYSSYEEYNGNLLQQPNSPRDPCIQVLPTLGPEVYKYYLHWVFGSLGVSLRMSTAIELPSPPARRARGSDRE